MEHWAVPFVTGKKYYLRWEYGLDFEQMLIDIEPWLWDENDLDVEFIMPFWDVREAIHVDDNFATRYDNNTIAATGNDFGSNLVLNDTDTRRFHLIVNGDDDDIYRV